MNHKPISNPRQFYLGFALALFGLGLILTKSTWAPSLHHVVETLPASASVRSATFGVVSEVGMFLSMLGIFLLFKSRRSGSAK